MTPSSLREMPDGDGLGLVLDGVDRPGQLLDRPREGGDEIVEERRR